MANPFLPTQEKHFLKSMPFAYKGEPKAVFLNPLSRSSIPRGGTRLTCLKSFPRVKCFIRVQDFNYTLNLVVGCIMCQFFDFSNYQ